ncbi:hypothetical protein N0V88_005030 [Collariella sp. IMI 366227]|nr:hypothetical protein N0V88_005030 [Collariella sp. IMI 366227]
MSTPYWHFRFLPTPISESILRPSKRDPGRFLAIDIGGSNLRVGFIELLGDAGPGLKATGKAIPLLNRLLEQSWPIHEHLKNQNSQNLFIWVGKRVAEVVQRGCEAFGLSPEDELPMGVTFSFPMEQMSLAEAVLMPMGKGFAVTSNLDLAGHLKMGYDKHRGQDMPRIKIAAITNDAVATLVSFVYQFPAKSHQKAAMGLIVGTGCNATIPLKLSSLHQSKRPSSISVLPGQKGTDVKIAVNTEWSIRGTAPPIRKLGLISRWDTELDQAGELPGFQPLEYMTAGRYLGELVRLVFVDYCTAVLRVPANTLPGKLQQRFGLTTTFLSHFYPNSPKGPMLLRLKENFPPEHFSFHWTPELADVLYRIAKATELRAAGIVAASIIGLLKCAEEIPEIPGEEIELTVGYTGGCIQHFQNYLTNTQMFVDQILGLEFDGSAPIRILLTPCHDGGITGAGILVPAALSSHMSHPGTGPGAEPIPTPGRLRLPRRRSRDDDSASTESEDMDPNDFDLLLSRSIQSVGPQLEPEALEHAMLRNTRVRSLSRTRRRRKSAGSPYSAQRRLSKPRTGAQQEEHTDAERATAPDEETPLLAAPEEDSQSDNPYLGGVTVTRFWLLFVQIMVAYFVACFDSTIMASSHPVITSYFGSSNSASWLSTAFLLTSTSFQPVLGGLSDAVGRKVPYLITVAVFLVATVWCALAQSMKILLTLSGRMNADGSRIRGAFQSYMNITYGVGSMLGAALGGVMADYLGWRWEFGVQVPLVVIVLVVSTVVVPDDLGLHGKQKKTLREALQTFDFKGSILMSTSVTFLILGLNLGGNVLPWSHPFVIASLTLFAVLFPLFLFVETLSVKPIMPLHLVLKSPHLNLVFSNHIAAFLSTATLFNVPLFFQGVLLTTATTSGFRLVISSAIASVTGTATGFLITWTRRLKWPLVLGTTFTLVGTLCLSSMQRGWPTLAYILCLLPGAAGSGFQYPGTFMAVLAVSDQREQAVVTGTLMLWRSLGSVLGVACTSLVVQNALWVYLEEYVQGPEKEMVVETVRRSVEAIRELPEVYQEQVVRSYEAALRMTFGCCVVLAVVSVGLILPVRLPRLGKKGGENTIESSDATSPEVHGHELQLYHPQLVGLNDSFYGNYIKLSQPKGN